MLNDIPIFPIQIQYKNDDHSLTYSSADSSIDGDEDTSIFTSLDGMMIDHNESEDHFISNDIGISFPSSFVELEQSIHEFEKWYVQCIKSSPQKGTNHGKSIKQDGETMIDAKVLLKRKEKKQIKAMQFIPITAINLGWLVQEPLWISARWSCSRSRKRCYSRDSASIKEKLETSTIPQQF